MPSPPCFTPSPKRAPIDAPLRLAPACAPAVTATLLTIPGHPRPWTQAAALLLRFPSLRPRPQATASALLALLAVPKGKATLLAALGHAPSSASPPPQRGRPSPQTLLACVSPTPVHSPTTSMCPRAVVDPLIRPRAVVPPHHHPAAATRSRRRPIVASASATCSSRVSTRWICPCLTRPGRSLPCHWHTHGRGARSPPRPAGFPHTGWSDHRCGRVARCRLAARRPLHTCLVSPACGTCCRFHPELETYLSSA